KAGRYSDVYGLGAILFFLVTGRPPFHADTVAETLECVLNNEPVSPLVLNPSVPEDIAAICLKCLEKDPAQRYATAQDLADELSRFLSDETVQARSHRWTNFGTTLWSDSKYAQEYRDHADEVIVERRYLFQVVRSFLRYFAEREELQICDLGCGDGSLAA